MNEQRHDEKKKDVLAEHILRAAGLSSDDLQAFQPVFRDAVANFLGRIAPLSAAQPFADLKAVETLKASDFEEILAKNSLISHFCAPVWGGDVLFVLEGELVDLMAEALFGTGEPVGNRRGGVDFTMVETAIGENISLHLAGAIDHVFGLGDGKLFALKQTLPASQFERQEFAKMRMFSCQIAVGFGDKSTHIRILLPRSCHRPIQEAVTRMLRSPSNQGDPLWARRLRQEISRAHVTIEAYIAQGEMSLEKLSHLHVGQILPLPVNVTKDVRLRSGNKPLYKCSLGKIGQNFSARVREPVDEEEEMIDGLVSAE